MTTKINNNYTLLVVQFERKNFWFRKLNERLPYKGVWLCAFPKELEDEINVITAVMEFGKRAEKYFTTLPNLKRAFKGLCGKYIFSDGVKEIYTRFAEVACDRPYTDKELDKFAKESREVLNMWDEIIWNKDLLSSRDTMKGEENNG